MKHQQNQIKHQWAQAKTKQECGPANEWNKGWWAQMETAQMSSGTNMNEGQWAWTRVSEHEQGLPKQMAGQA